MSTLSSIKRFMLIVGKISDSSLPSFTEIEDHLRDHGFKTSARTLQRDLNRIRKDFGISIYFDRLRNGYHLSSESAAPADTLLRFMEILESAEFLSQELLNDPRLLEQVLFEDSGRLRGIENLRTLLGGIRGRRKVRFIHESYHHLKKKQVVLKPYLLKEYQGRWYVIGIPDGRNDFRTFALDRISELKLLRDSFRFGTVNPRTLFEDVIGLVYEEDTETIELLIDETQEKYFRSLPWHISQRITETGEGFVVTLRVKPNYEFRQKLLTQMDHAVVLRPRWLRKEMEQILRKMLKSYQ